MAAVRQNKTTSIILKLETGEDGATTYVNNTFSRVNPNLTDSDCFTVASGLAGLIKYPLSAIRRQDTATLVNS